MSSWISPLVLSLLWLAAAVAIPVRAYLQPPAWDVAIYLRAVHSVAIGHDPYADSVAVQQKFHEEIALHPGELFPSNYIYSPMTLPLVRLAALLPRWFNGVVYWSFYLAGLLSQIYFGFQACTLTERKYIRFLAPAAAFFPGLLASDIVWSGNIAFILYGAILAAVAFGWRRNRWFAFYSIVIIASCFKFPLLSLLIIPALSACRQWLSSTIAASAGIALFVVQPLLWPTTFHHYLQAIQLQFTFNSDFGSSPSGLFSGFLFDRGIPYLPGALIFFLAYALPLCGLLFYLSRRYLRGAFTLRQWVPVLILGVILLNPRLIEYDEIVLAIPLTLIGWRFLSAFVSSLHAAIILSVIFLAANATAFQSWQAWKLTEGCLLVVFLAMGVWTLLYQPARTQSANSRY